MPSGLSRRAFWPSWSMNAMLVHCWSTGQLPYTRPSLKHDLGRHTYLSSSLALIHLHVLVIANAKQHIIIIIIIIYVRLISRGNILLCYSFFLFYIIILVSFFFNLPALFSHTLFFFWQNLPLLSLLGIKLSP